MNESMVFTHQVWHQEADNQWLELNRLVLK
jgi:hypothetical protein